MPDDSTAHESTGSSPSTIAISSDTLCLTCGYNLRGLQRSGSCPECGLAILETVITRQGMTKFELATLVFRASAIWFFLLTFHEMIQIVQSGFVTFMWVAMYTLVFGLQCLLWWKAERLAHYAVKSDGPISLTGALQYRELFSVALSIIGVLYLIYGITGSVWIMSTLLLDLQQDYLGVSIINTCMNMVISWVLLFGATRIAKAVIWLRTAGTRRDNQV